MRSGCSPELKMMLSLGKYNARFALFIAAVKKHTLTELRDNLLERDFSLISANKVNGDLVSADEWYGTGIQKKVAVARIKKFFAICLNNDQRLLSARVALRGTF